ncbi:MAG: TetR/AcrR family transcriptional regulator [Armatimonadota bacterium]|nr:TetR/AcrR family transcriptional regulator [Armatimonadota bacterium]MDR7447758.1 TetR/AcrR family transcriptional regulator [Armatimonadota bacterium]MDR7479908.1 TetR/AcrR family transcriptional regulator [Armatimonadota bacterium]MDR7487744.1 TetR/AcrR family transcriptional regulator [Armatimonadota bacterium]MDR7490422.1 TetR/AcrR family transcriptional regulator [Armatimonadota bacterium]
MSHSLRPFRRGPGAPPPQARGRRTRQRLLAAAEAAFGSRGYFAASVADITRRARVAQGTFYLYFPSKRAIFEELVRQLSHDLRRTIQQRVAGLTDRRQVEREGFLAFFHFIRRHRAMYRIIRQAELVHPAIYRWYYRRIAEGYARGLRTAMAQGQIRPLDPEVLAYCLMGIGDFLGMRWVLWERRAPPPRVVEAMMAFVLRGMDASAPGRSAAGGVPGRAAARAR